MSGCAQITRADWAFDVNDINSARERHNDLVDDPSLPGARLARRWLTGATVLATGALLVYLASSLLVRDGIAGLDLQLMQLLRVDGIGSDPIGPQWLEGFARDLTALGGNGLLLLVVVLSVVILSLGGRHGPAMLLGWASLGAYLLNNVIKFGFGRARPDFIAPTVLVESSSFPSSHAMLSSVVYLLLAAIVARETTDRRLALLLLGSAAAVVVAIGLTRMYLGAHWGSDVLAGWTLGTGFALGSWMVARSPRAPG